MYYKSVKSNLKLQTYAEGFNTDECEVGRGVFHMESELYKVTLYYDDPYLTYIYGIIKLASG